MTPNRALAPQVTTFGGFVNPALGSQILTGGLTGTGSYQSQPSSFSAVSGIRSTPNYAGAGVALPTFNSYAAPTIGDFSSSLAASSNVSTLGRASSASLLSQPTVRFDPGAGSRVAKVEQLGNGWAGQSFTASAADLEQRAVASSSKLSAFGNQWSAQANKVAAYTLNTVFGHVEPARRVTYEDGSTKLLLGGEPDTRSLAGQALLLAPVLLKTPAPAVPPPVLRGPVAQTAAGKNFIPVTHVEAAASEFDLIRSVQDQGGVILRSNKTVTSNGADIISYSPKTGQVTLWDSKTTIGRLGANGVRLPQTVKPSPTLTNQKTLNNALRDAREAIEKSNLSAADQTRAFQSIRDQTYRKVTAGAGNAKNSVIQYGP